MTDTGDKIKHKAEELKGKLKEGVGKATGNEEMAGEGQREQAEAKVKKVGDKVGDTVDDATDRLKGLVGNDDKNDR